MSLYSSLQQKDILVWTGYSSDRNPDATNLPKKEKKRKKNLPQKKRKKFKSIFPSRYVTAGLWR